MASRLLAAAAMLTETASLSSRDALVNPRTSDPGESNTIDAFATSTFRKAQRLMRIGIIALLQESNTFIGQPTTLAHFEQELLVTGEAVRERLAGTHHEVAGMFHALEEAGEEAVPIFAARAVPFGVIEAAAIERLLEIMFGELAKAGPLDGILVAPHGATVSQPHPDVDGHWLGELRRQLGPDKPIIGTIDPHANLSPAMVAAADALIAYRTNPHIDQIGRAHV